MPTHLTLTSIPIFHLKFGMGWKLKDLDLRELFGVETSSSNAPRNKYTTQSSAIRKGRKEIVKIYIQGNHANTHGILKDTASFSTNGTA